MFEFKNVTIIKKANIYFDGKVSSRIVFFPMAPEKPSELSVAKKF